MGREAVCRVSVGDRSWDGKALLETDSLVFRSHAHTKRRADFRLSIPFSAISSVEARNGALRVVHGRGSAVFELGAEAEKWAQRIANPKGLLDKLGVKPGMRASVIGIEDAAFLAELRSRTKDISIGAAEPASDLIFVAADTPDDMSRLSESRTRIKPQGAVWVG